MRGRPGPPVPPQEPPCDCENCARLSDAMRVHLAALGHVLATREAVERAGRCADQAHGFEAVRKSDR